ncbi:hypothetical protein J5X07_00065 [Actinomyces bowdenii]|uniref:LppM family (lipo)protein n=1 Tax=Actinomyces bowdenii TaxID=131109 RepID=UPI001ABC089A|nr:hypothetical protein [Actinomyces bowdenii]MBO3723438.1 hypothetical protein [Actinomyces bowdenii]
MNPASSARRTHRALRALALSLPLGLSLVLALALPSPVGHALAASGSAQDDYDISFDITISPDDTYSLKMVLVDRSTTPRITQEQCTIESFSSGGTGLSDGTAEFIEKDGVRTCTVTGSEPISQTKGLITHEDDEYVVDTGDFAGSDEVRMSLTVTFPGEVTESDGGTVRGTSVSFDSIGGHVVRGQDSPSGLPWLWIILGVVGVLATVGVVLAVILLGRRRSGATAGASPSAAHQSGPEALPAPGAPQAAGPFPADPQAPQTQAAGAVPPAGPPQAGLAPQPQQPPEAWQQPPGQAPVAQVPQQPWPAAPQAPGSAAAPQPQPQPWQQPEDPSRFQQ